MCNVKIDKRIDSYDQIKEVARRIGENSNLDEVAIINYKPSDNEYLEISIHTFRSKLLVGAENENKKNEI